MTVDQLIKLLERYEGSLEVFVSRDAEGNDFNSLYTVSTENSEDIEVNSDGPVVVLWP